MPKFIHSAVFLSCLLVFASLLGACSEPAPAEEQIEKNINAISTAIEALDSDALSSLLSDDIEIEAASSSWDIERIKKLFLVYRFRKQNISVKLIKNDITLNQYNSHVAKATSSVLITGGKGLLPEDGRLYEVKSEWRLIDDEWLPTDVSWK